MLHTEHWNYSTCTRKKKVSCNFVVKHHGMSVTDDTRVRLLLSDEAAPRIISNSLATPT